MAVLYTPHFVQFFDDNGDPLAGGKLYTYSAGTVTPKATYTAADGLTPNANPVVLDAAGRAVIFLNGSYKFRLETSASVLVREVDNVSAFSTSAVTIDSLVPTQSGNAGKSLVTDGSTVSWGYSGPQILAFKDKVLNGLTISNNGTDAVNDIDVAPGSCVSDDGTTVMTITSSITKQLDVAWAVGSNQGGRDTGSIANGTWHVWVINRVDTGVCDILLSLSASAPTMPTSYTKKKRIGSIIRASGSILLFRQNADDFILNSPTLDVDSTNPGASAVLNTLASIPNGIRVKAILNVVATNGTNNFSLYISSPDSTDLAPSTTAAPLCQWVDSAGTETTAAGQLEIWTNTSSQIRTRMSISGVADNFKIATVGWYDPR